MAAVELKRCSVCTLVAVAAK